MRRPRPPLRGAEGVQPPPPALRLEGAALEREGGEPTGWIRIEAALCPETERNLQDYVAECTGDLQGGLLWKLQRFGIGESGAFDEALVTVGGSETATALGIGYDSRANLVEKKVGCRMWAGNGYTWWGDLFEPVTQRYVELDLGTRVHGGDMPSIAGTFGNSYSPDGLCVVRAAFYADGTSQLCEGVGDPAAERGADVHRCPAHSPGGAPFVGYADSGVLLEIKSPARRVPKGAVPKHYLPQPLAGLYIIPCAEYSLFVDGAYRKCGLDDLADPGRWWAYDRGYHRERTRWESLAAWGLIAVYAPASRGAWLRGGGSATASFAEALRGDGAMLAALGAAGLDVGALLRETDVDPAMGAWEILRQAHGQYLDLPEPPTSPEDPEALAAAAAGRPVVLSGPPGVVDLGAAGQEVFEAVTRGLRERHFVARPGDPCFADGRGGGLRGPAAVEAAVAAATDSAPAGHYLLGVIPWKLFMLEYVPVAPDFDYIEREVRPAVEATRAEIIRRRRGGAPPPEPEPEVDEEVAELFAASFAALSLGASAAGGAGGAGT